MMNDGAGTPVTVVHDVNCPVCKRFLNKVEVIGPGVVRVWANCRYCGKWRWCTVGGVASEA
jgi:hypothetical protein